ncbi:FAD-binding protein [Bradyrhizobium sp. RDI18]|uniref:FAD-binding protein n=1 Tax=Bradyrhizobium sp. RDI18 TaxID=3367400 RepID=UPI003718EA2F
MQTSRTCRDLGLEAAETGSIALEEADFIVSAGNGVTNVATLEEMAACFDAAVGASRVAVDDGEVSAQQTDRCVRQVR